jgi:type IV secretion system protein VirB4
MADIRIIAVREDTNLEPAFWAQFPGNETYAVRRALISTANAAGFLAPRISLGARGALGRCHHRL